MNIREFSPDALSKLQSRRFPAAWLLTLAAALVVLLTQYIKVVLPVPFMMIVLITVAMSGAAGGVRSGFIAGLIMTSMIVYFFATGRGPEPLTGTPIRAAMGALVAMGVGVYFGQIRDRIVALFDEVQDNRRKLAHINDQLADRVADRTRELQATSDRLRISQEQLKQVTRRWLETQEIERRGLARDLHDDIGQSLTALLLNLEGFRPKVDADPDLSRLVGTSIELVDCIFDGVRQLSLNLRPSLLDDIGLSAAIREHASQLLGVSGIEADVRQVGDESGIDANTSITAYRLAQEAIANVLKHSGANRVDIETKIDNNDLMLTVSDDGRGFDTSAQRRQSEHFGLVSMTERASMMGGSCVVTSALGVGTSVRITLPIARKEAVA